MRQKTFFLVIILTTMLLVSACGQGATTNSSSSENSGRQYEDDQMIGNVWTVDQAKNTVEMDISEWVKRDSNSDTDEGYSYIADFSEETAITYEDGTTASVEDIKNGQKVLVNPPMKGHDFKGHADEIVLLDMTFEETHGRLLSHIDGYNLVVMYEYGDPPPPEMDESMYGKVSTMLVGQHDVVASWVEYDPNYVVDFKEELDIEQFPVILVYDEKELLFKSNNVEEVYAFFEDVKN